MPGHEGRGEGPEGSGSREMRGGRNNDGSEDVTVPAAVPPAASTSSGTLPISGHATILHVRAANLKPGGTDDRGKEKKENPSSNDGSDGRGAGPRGPPPEQWGQEHDDPPSSPSSLATTSATHALPVPLSNTAAAHERSTARPSRDTASGSRAGSSASTVRKSKAGVTEHQSSTQDAANKVKDKGKRRADDESIDHELDDTKLSKPNLREAVELAALPPFLHSPSSSAAGAASRSSRRRIRGGEHESAGDGGEAPSQPQSATGSGSGSGSSSMRNLSGPLWWQAVQRWWKRHVSVTVEAKGMRDHLALERTFLGYLRTSIALSMTGVVIAQLFRLQHSLHPDAHLGFFVLGIPLASTFIACAIVVALLGAFRFWRQQGAIARGKVLAGGWEVLVIMVGSLLLTTGVFILLVLVDVRREKVSTLKM